MTNVTPNPSTSREAIYDKQKRFGATPVATVRVTDTGDTRVTQTGDRRIVKLTA